MHTFLQLMVQLSLGGPCQRLCCKNRTCGESCCAPFSLDSMTDVVRQVNIHVPVLLFLVSHDSAALFI